MHLDTRTEAVVGTLAAFAVSFLYILLWQARRTYPGFGQWTAGLVSVAVSLMALTVRGPLPLVPSVLITNAAAFLSELLLLEGTRKFVGVPHRSIPARAVAVSAMALQVFFLLGSPDEAARIIVSSAASFVLVMATGVVLFRSSMLGRKMGYWFTGGLMLMGALVNLGRALFVAAHYPAVGVFTPTAWNQLFFVGTIMAVIGAPFGFIMINHDRLVGDLVEAERRAANADKAKSEFLAHISHEIRTPLNGVIGLTGLVLDGPLNEGKRSELETAVRSAEALREIVNDVLDLSKIEAGMLPIVKAPFDLYSVLARAKALIEPRATSKSIACRLLYADGMPRWFAGDEMRVRQIVGNFAANAVKFTANGEIELGAELAQGRVRIWVRDTGPGIAREKIPTLFSKFAQADASIAVQYGGTGLGLAIAKELAELMRGKVGVASEVGRGSTFWAELPLAAAAPPVPPGAAAESLPAGLAGLRALVAEDNPVNQLVLLRSLERYGLAVDLVANGEEAVRRCESNEYAVILMDCRMPVLDGYEATRRIRQQERTTGRRTPIIAITANAMTSDRELCEDAGMDDYLTKPIEPAELARCIARYALAPDTEPRG
jgi:signal transduction histidine kinase/ActR/RegA family two-component response regulator